MNDNQLAVREESRYLSPAATIQEAIARYNLVVEFTQRVMKAGKDYGPIPGTDKPTLLKPGAEKLSSLFGLNPMFEVTEKELDWTGEKHGGEPFFYFQYRCSMYNGGRNIAQGVGSCNSWEKKYRYRNADRTCPNCGKATIFKSKTKPEYYCWSKKGGCGAVFPLNDKRISEQITGQVKNTDPADIVNTIDKMAQKRALIAATLIATNASEYFTQDLDDFIEGEVAEVPPHVEPIQAAKDTITHVQAQAEAVIAKTAVKHNGDLTLEEAKAIMSTENVPYGEIPTEKLSRMANSINKKLQDGGYSSENQDIYIRKLNAIKLILADRPA